jgi:hypothetical protein
MKTTLPIDSEERKRVPLYRGPLRYFPAALAGVAKVCDAGNRKHNPGEEMHHARGKSTDHADCILRHLVDMSEDFGAGLGRDENGVPQVDYIAWRALALAQEWHEKHAGVPLAPGARMPVASSPELAPDERGAGRAAPAAPADLPGLVWYPDLIADMPITLEKAVHEFGAVADEHGAVWVRGHDGSLVIDRRIPLRARP